MRFKETIQNIKDIPEQLRFISQMAGIAFVLAVFAVFLGVVANAH